MKKSFSIPKEIEKISETLEKEGFEAYVVGGCVRDLILGKEPKDWDMTTNAKPEEIIRLFEHTFYENKFGTVVVVNDGVEDQSSLKTVEITPYRTESAYHDYRHPDEVKFAETLEEDLLRRDFTMNALAYSVSKDLVIDIYGGLKDIHSSLIRTVGKSADRFTEDALRMLRAIRFQAELGFSIDTDTEKAILENGHLLQHISRERIRDELVKIVMSDQPMMAFLSLKKLGLLPFVIAELEDTVGIEQRGAHKFDVWEHLLRSLQHAADKKYSLEIRLAALFHDISKPESRRWNKEQNVWTFYGHEVIGARVTKKILENLKFPKKIIDKVVTLVRWHMFFADTEQISLTAVRRMVANVGKENIWDLMDVRICDRIGTGRPKEDPYRLRKYHAMIEEALRDPVSVGMLKIDGKKIMEITATNPGPKIGFILHGLLEEVLEDPSKNTEEYLENKAQTLINLPEEELKLLGEKGKELKEEKEEQEIAEIHKKHRV